MSDKVYVGDIGTDIIVNCGSDISDATDRKLMVKKPDGSIVEWDADIYQSNYLKYTIVDGDFNLQGVYKLQASLTLSGWSGRGETVNFTVYPVYDE